MIFELRAKHEDQRVIGKKTEVGDSRAREQPRGRRLQGKGTK